jgi:hypothetical protein
MEEVNSTMNSRKEGRGIKKKDGGGEFNYDTL